jgi:hypothetical protein
MAPHSYKLNMCEVEVAIEALYFFIKDWPQHNMHKDAKKLLKKINSAHTNWSAPAPRSAPDHRPIPTK